MRRPVIVTHADGEEFTYSSIRAVLIELHLHPPSIHRALKHRKPMNKGPYRGWSFRYADSPVPAPVQRQAVAAPPEYASYPSSRYEAKQVGATHYFTGYPCKHGHIALRKVQGACTECVREAWEIAKVSRKTYFEEYRKRPEVVARAKTYYQKNLNDGQIVEPVVSAEPVQSVQNPTYKELIEQARVKSR